MPAECSRAVTAECFRAVTARGALAPPARDAVGGDKAVGCAGFVGHSRHGTRSGLRVRVPQPDISVYILCFRVAAWSQICIGGPHFHDHGSLVSYIAVFDP